MHALLNVWDDLQSRFADYGLARTTYGFVMRRLHRLGFTLFQVQIGDDSNDIQDPDLPPGYTCEKVMPEDLLPWAKPEYGLKAEAIQEATNNGDRCVANFYHGDLVGYGFVTPTRARATSQLDVVIDDRLVYRYRGWTHPDHRRKQLSFARGRLNKTLFPLKDGRRTVSYVVTYNFPSKLHSSKLRPIHIGYCGYFRIFGTEYPFTLRRPRRYGFRLERRLNPQTSS